MTMDRRTVLKNLGIAGTIGGLAGCVGVQEQGSTEEPSSDGGSGDGGSESSGSETTESSGPAGEAKLWYSLPDSEIQARKNAMQQFNDQSKHAVTGADIADLEKKTTSAIPAGQGPQSFEWAHDWVGDYYQRNFVVGRGDSLSVSLDTFTDAAAEAVQFDGETVGLPHSAETVSLVYNKDKVDSAPETVADMVSVMEEQHDPSNNSYGLSYPFNSYFVSAWLQAFGGYYFDSEKDPQLGIDQSSTVEGLQFILDNFVPYVPKDPSYEAQAAAFAEGNAAFAFNGPWYLATLNEKGVNYGVTTLPKPEGGEPTPYTGITMWYFSKAMKEGGADAMAAQKFIEWYVTNEDRALMAAEEQGTIPVLKSLAGSEDLPPRVRAFSEAVAQGRPMPTHPKMNKVWGPLDDALIKSFNGDAKPKKALEQAAATVRKNWE
ncbi:extracellular solute-binding protein [Halogranum rubrum]|nr:extracellular solute-binding protein [Halogranum rubrum]